MESITNKICPKCQRSFPKERFQYPDISYGLSNPKIVTDCYCGNCRCDIRDGRTIRHSGNPSPFEEEEEFPDYYE